MTFNDLDITAFGNSSMLAGVIYTGRPNVIFWLPYGEPRVIGEEIVLTDDEWKKILDQTDAVNTEVSVAGKKAIFRKCLRYIDQNISWRVYAGDGYRCRYCDRTALPLTVDHIDLWEKGGATIEENLISACKRCNKIRGNMAYADWLRSAEYASVSGPLSEEKKQANLDVLTTLPHLETLRVKDIKSR